MNALVLKHPELSKYDKAVINPNDKFTGVIYNAGMSQYAKFVTKIPCKNIPVFLYAQNDGTKMYYDIQYTWCYVGSSTQKTQSYQQYVNIQDISSTENGFLVFTIQNLGGTSSNVNVVSTLKCELTWLHTYPAIIIGA